MKKIDSLNVVEYINFLHRMRLGTDAPNEVLDAWKKVPNDLIQSELNKMYLNWNVDYPTYSQWEDSFIYNSSTGTGNSKLTIRLLLALVIIACIAIVFVYFNKNEKDKQYNYVDSIPKQTEVNLKEINNEAMEAIGDEIDYQKSEGDRLRQENLELELKNKKLKEENNKLASQNLNKTQSQNAASNNYDIDLIDKNNINTIEKLLGAEEQQNLQSISDCFELNIQRYWDMNNISIAQLNDKYRSSWERISNIYYSGVSWKKISNNKYQVSGKYNFYSKKENIHKSINFSNIYLFNKYGKIIQVYGK